MTSQKYFEEAWNNRKLVGGALKASTFDLTITSMRTYCKME